MTETTMADWCPTVICMSSLELSSEQKALDVLYRQSEANEVLSAHALVSVAVSAGEAAALPLLV